MQMRLLSEGKLCRQRRQCQDNSCKLDALWKDYEGKRQGRNNRVGRVGKVQGAPECQAKYRPNYFLVITVNIYGS